MKNIYKQIVLLSEQDPSNLSDTTLKFVEEAGELVREINRKTGRKIKAGLSEKQIEKNIKEELADSLQTLLSLSYKLGVSYEDLKESVKRKNKVWEKINSEKVK